MPVEKHDKSQMAVDASSTTSSDENQQKHDKEQLKQITESSSSPKSGDNAGQIILEKISNDILTLVNTSSNVPFIGVSGAGASGKSYFC